MQIPGRDIFLLAQFLKFSQISGLFSRRAEHQHHTRGGWYPPHSAVGFPSLRVKDFCYTPELCALPSGLGSWQAQPMAQTNISSDKLYPKLPSDQSARDLRGPKLNSSGADKCLSPGFGIRYEGTLLFFGHGG